MAERVEKSIEVNVPVHVAYNQWTQFEDFPEFMDGVKEIRQIDDKHLHWVTEIFGHREEFEAEIFEQVPDQHIAWRSTSGPYHAGRVSFQPVGEHTKVMLEMDYEPEGVVEKVGDRLGMLDRRVQSDLENFKKFIESRGQSTGAWRGRIEGGHVQGS